MMRQAYVVMIASEFWSRQRHYTEVGEKDERLLRRLRLQVALGYTLFFLNTIFFLVCTFLMCYMFRHSDPRANYILSPLLTSSLLWFISQKNEESRLRRLSSHK
ncbi:hypothetical protein AGDE_06195 [Angomonas deanei]|nr:hypothetical protein AGDE_08854 [Angomonas deanei]EPY37739.1 hypothetical protein AGDE_06195 [Angomonas deanei]|eukprot:EPY32123.1 hypothetical protein AGDE_08854 [Angomonas deanei]